MLRFRGWTTIALVVLAPSCARTQQRHPFNVEDDIAMVRFSGTLAQSTLPMDGSTGLSPNHRYVAVVTSRGVLATDRIESQLWLFAVARIAPALADASRAMPKPRLIASVTSYPHREQTRPYAALIKDVRWSADSRALYFRRENEQGITQLCALDIGRHRLQVLSAPQENVNHFDVSGHTVLYTSARPDSTHSTAGVTINSDAMVVTGLPIFEILFPDEVIQGAPETWKLTVVRRHTNGPTVQQVRGFVLRDRSLLSSLIPFKLSPDGKSAITLLPAPDIPSAWERYEPAAGMEHLQFRGGDPDVLDPRNGNRPQEYVRIDLRTGKQTTLVAAPDGRSLDTHNLG